MRCLGSRLLEEIEKLPNDEIQASRLSADGRIRDDSAHDISGQRFHALLNHVAGGRSFVEGRTRITAGLKRIAQRSEKRERSRRDLRSSPTSVRVAGCRSMWVYP